ncbi:MAG: serine hydrolase [Candidatus Aenigmatarchaeota archaeon]
MGLYFTTIGIGAEDLQSGNFFFLDPSGPSMDMSQFLETKNNYTVSYMPLKEEITQILSDADGDFGVYFEDLEIDAWFGVNEREAFRPASLLKTTTVATILKEVEEGEASLDTEVALTKGDIANFEFENSYAKEDQNMTIRQLIEITLIHSDNTALNKLYGYVINDRWIETRLRMGMPLSVSFESSGDIALSPKEFSNVFHSLYYSGYLSKCSSNWMLMLMSETDFVDGIPAGVSKGVVVSHKIGLWADYGSVHDCGIVYAKRPYILCIMSKNTTLEEGNRVIKEISETVYDHVSAPL